MSRDRSQQVAEQVALESRGGAIYYFSMNFPLPSIPFFNFTLSLLIISSVSVVPSPLFAQPDPVEPGVDWPSFLERLDPVWEDFDDRDARGFYASAQIGNGLLGLAIFAEEDNHGDMIFEVGRKDVTATRDPADWKSYIDTMALARGRLPIGYFKLDPVGTVQSADMRVDLWNAEARGEIVTSAGTIFWRAFSHAIEEYMVVEISTTAGESVAGFEFFPRISRFPKFDRYASFTLEGYEPNPDPDIYTDQGIHVVRQPYLETSGEYATGWKSLSPEADLRRIYISVARAEEGNAPRTDIVNTVLQAASGNITDQISTHRQWWHSFWAQSFISLPDPALESNYYIQLHRFASATRPDRPMIDLLDAWYNGTGWPATWWNLNTQLSYEWVAKSGRPSLHESLNNHLRENLANLEANAPGTDTIGIGKISSFDLSSPTDNDPGSFLWTMRSVWLWYRMDMNEAAMREWLYPMMELAANHIIQNWLGQDASGQYNIRSNSSPERGGGENTHYSLAGFRWILTALIDAAERYDLQDPDTAQYRNILENLAPYPVDDLGWMISDTSSFNRPHRHFSYLLDLYWGMSDLSDMQSRGIAEKSLVNFLTVGGPGGDRTGYTFGAASSMLARLGRSEEAYEHLRYLVLKVLQTNATYREGGGPVSETAYGSAGWTQDLLLQYQHGMLALFPGLPGSVPEAAFHDLAAEGGFRVSAVRENGVTKWVRVKSLAGEPCLIRGDFGGTPGIIASPGVALESVGVNTWEINGLEAGEWALVHSGANPPVNPTIMPIDGPSEDYNYWGSERAKDNEVPTYPEVNINQGATVIAASPMQD